MFAEPALIHHPKDTFGHCAIFHRGENGLSILMVSFDDFQWNIKQLYLEGYLGLMPLGDDPGSTVDGDDVRRFKFLHVNKCQTCESGKYKNVAREVECRFFKVMRHQQTDFLFRQIFPRTDVLRNVELTKGIPFDESSGKSSGDYPLK